MTSSWEKAGRLHWGIIPGIDTESGRIIQAQIKLWNERADKRLLSDKEGLKRIMKEIRKKEKR